MTDETSAEPGAAGARHSAGRHHPGPDETDTGPPSVDPADGGGAVPETEGGAARAGGRRFFRRKADDGKPFRTKKKTSFWRELPVLLVIALVLAVVIKTFLVQAFFIPSGSMETTLHGCPGCSGDRVLVNKLTYRFHEPRQGDIVVFRGPESWAPEVQVAEPSNVVQKAVRAFGQVIGVAQPSEKDFIKRVIAIGGQTVQCCDAQGRVMVDGKALNEPYVFLDGEQDKELSNFGPIKVPAGRLWVMGDHRNASADSRYHTGDGNLGTISVDDVVGKAFVIVWPPSRWDTLGYSGSYAALGTLNAPAPIAMSLGMVLPIGLLRRRRRSGRTRDRRGPPGRDGEPPSADRRRSYRLGRGSPR